MSLVTNQNYFQFEEDFVEDNVRCIPMIVRFKLDACGIKLKLSEWSKMTVGEREVLATMKCDSTKEVREYREFLQHVIYGHTANIATEIPVTENPAWAIKDEIPFPLAEKLKEFDWTISLSRWQRLTDLQRFALLKLSYPGHENRNFPRAMKEFELI